MSCVGGQLSRDDFQNSENESRIVEFSLNVFTELSEFSDKNIIILKKGSNSLEFFVFNTNLTFLYKIDIESFKK